ncbi:MAG: urease accessory protein UreD [Motiliproteus sp.]
MSQALSNPLLETANFGQHRQWHASIELRFEPRNGRTALPGLSHCGPLRVQRPFYPEGPVCHVYLLHPPGGLVSGDRLAISAQLEADSQALITTPSAGKIYKGDSCGVSQQQQVNLKVGVDASLEWLPQETILYDGALGHSQTRVDLTEGSRFIGWEIICLGRPANAITFDNGCFLQDMAIYRDDLPLLLEKQHLQAGSPLAKQRWGLQDCPVVGNLYATGFGDSASEPTELIDQLRQQWKDMATADELLAISWRLGVLCIRYLGHDTEQARNAFTALWQILRPALLDREAVIPRIWLT